MLRINENKLVKISVMGSISSPISSIYTYRISATGQPVVLPGAGGITYNVRVGDLATGWEADHVEPGVSIKNLSKSGFESYGYNPNLALNLLACIGNEGIVASGSAKGEKGVVVGKHGGIDHVLMDFKPNVTEKLLIGDKIQIKAYGVGLKLLDYPEIKVMNMDPKLLRAINPKPRGDNKLEIPVTHKVPAKVMGSGLGSIQAYTGDYDIQLFDEETKMKYGLEDLRLGDLVAILDTDHSYGRIYKKGAITIGVIVHSDCVIAGHGPGVTTLFTCSTRKIVPRKNPKANLAYFLKLRKELYG
jgi:hypothetical protein